jgi:regulator of protease activity HflC (stomatin/prohibitin superfamily)
MEVRRLRLGGILTIVFVSILGGMMSFLRTVTGLAYVRNNEVALKLRFHQAQRERTSPYFTYKLWRPVSWLSIWYPKWVPYEERCQGKFIIGYTGLHGGVPFVHHWARFCASEEPEKTEKTSCILADRMNYNVVGALRWKILGDLKLKNHNPDDVVNAHFASSDLKTSIRNSAEQCMSSVLRRTRLEDFIDDSQAVCNEIKDDLQAITGLWGIEIIEVGFTYFQATPRTELLAQLPTMIEMLNQADLSRLEGQEGLVAALTGSMLSLTAAQASHEQQSEHDEQLHHKDVREAPLGVLHGLPPKK